MFDIINSDVYILWLYNIMDRIYKYNVNVSYKPNGGRYLFVDPKYNCGGTLRS